MWTLAPSFTRCRGGAGQRQLAQGLVWDRVAACSSLIQKTCGGQGASRSRDRLRAEHGIHIQKSVAGGAGGETVHGKAGVQAYTGQLRVGGGQKNGGRQAVHASAVRAARHALLLHAHRAARRGHIPLCIQSTGQWRGAFKRAHTVQRGKAVQPRLPIGSGSQQAGCQASPPLPPLRTCRWRAVRPWNGGGCTLFATLATAAIASCTSVLTGRCASAHRASTRCSAATHRASARCSAAAILCSSRSSAASS